MKKIFIGVLSGALVLGSSGLAATAAQAYDREAFAHAASHYVSPNQLPKIFAAEPRMNVEVRNSGNSGASVCSSAFVNGPEVELAKSTRNSLAFYESRTSDIRLDISVDEYRTNIEAEKAFAKLTKDIKKCDGDYSGSWTSEDDMVFPYRNVVTSGKIPAVTVAGVASIFTNRNSESAAVGVQPAFLDDVLSIYTLVNDAIIQTQASNWGRFNITAPQRKALEQAANLMVTEWVS
jgi:hypothetical protein